MKAPPKTILSIVAFACLILLSSCGGQTGGTGSSGSPSVKLTANPPKISPGGTSKLSWSSQDVSSVVSSNFGASGVSGSMTVGPLSSTTNYSITCKGPDGNATGTTTVVVSSGTVSSIPGGVLLYSVQQGDGSTILYYQPTAGGSAVEVGNFATGVRVLATNPTGTRLLLVEPLLSQPGKKAAYVTDLDGVSNAVRMSGDYDNDATDGAITVSGDVLVAWSNLPARNYSLSGDLLGTAPYGLISSNSVTIASNAAGTVAYYNDRVSSALESSGLPTFDHQSNLEGNAAYNWVRADPTGALITYCVGTTISTASASNGANQTVIAAGSYPTFDSTGSKVYYAKVGDGIYVHDLSKSTDSRLVAISGAWDGHLSFH